MLFSIMGPPQLGDLNAPRLLPPDAAADLCDTCAEPWGRHGRVRTDNRTYLTCPDPPAGAPER